LKIDTVLFDLDDTLVFEMSSEAKAFAAACGVAHGKLGVDPAALQEAVRRRARELWRAAPTYSYCQAMGIASWEGLWGAFTGADPNLRALRAWAPGYRREAWTRGLTDVGARDGSLAEELSAFYQRQRRKRHIAFPDAHAVLKDLARARQLGIVTNGAPDIQREKLNGVGLGGYFGAIVVSGEVGIGKPDPRIFALALERLGAQPACAVMVGDSPARDIAGGRAAGLRTVLITYAGPKAPGEDAPKPDARIAALSDLPETLAAW